MVYGIVLLDKPEGITSNRALQQIKRLLQADKAGHTGSLDPLATGVLPICLGNATKFSRFLLAENKSYLVTARLGITTDSGDKDGKVINQFPDKIPNLHFAEMQTVLTKFIGQIQQIPPMYSALKQQGRPLYKLARKGIEVERQPRLITIYQINLLTLEHDLLTFTVDCSKGTYIRTLVEDIGKYLQCGAHVVALRRTSVGNYSIDNAVTLAQLQEYVPKQSIEQVVLPISTAVADFSKVILNEQELYRLKCGQTVIISDPTTPYTRWVQFIDVKSDQFLGVGEILSDGLVRDRILVV